MTTTEEVIGWFHDVICVTLQTTTFSSENFNCKYSCAPVSTGNMFQDLPRLRETADKTERYV
jgi:hypothetical protein